MFSNNDTEKGEEEILASEMAQEVIKKEQKKRILIDDEEANIKEKCANHYIAGVLTGLILSVILIVGMYIFVRPVQEDGIDDNLSQITDTGSNSDFSYILSKEKLLMAYMQKYYYYDIDMEVLEEKICDAMLEALGDKYAGYFTVEEFAEILESNRGEYCGIGVAVMQDAETLEITVTQPYENAPGAEAGILVGDIIVAVDGKDVRKEDLSTVVAMIKGEEGTKVSVTVLRNGNEFTMEMTREVVEIDSVTYELDGDKAYIYISSFDDNTPEQFKNALDKAKKDGAKGLILDLRNNPGGSLPSVVSMLDYIVADGLLVYIEDKGGAREEFYATSTDSIELPIVCLVNQYSASAAELFTGTLQKYDLATIVGVTTYGKGVVQTLRPLSDGSAFKFTTSKYFISGGINIDGIGIIPDVRVELNADAVGDDGVVIKEKDMQYKTAVEELDKLINTVK